MTANLLLSAGAMLFGLFVLRRFAGNGGRGAVTTADLAVVLSAAEIVQLLYTASSVDTQLHGDGAVLPTLCVVGIGLVVAGSFLRWIGTVVTALGIVAAFADEWLKDGPSVAGMLLVLLALLWLINRLVRVIAPW